MFYSQWVLNYLYLFQILMNGIFASKGAKVGGLPSMWSFCARFWRNIVPMPFGKLHKKDLFLPLPLEGAGGMAAFACRVTKL
jgi:hypothetical protein